MFQNICAIPLDRDLFTQAIHPSEPIVSVGLSSGHVQTYRLPAGASDDDGDETLASENGFGHIETAWKTRRHKGSCRALSFAIDGSQLFSAGTDGIVKAADSGTGQVVAKIAVPYDPYVLIPCFPNKYSNNCIQKRQCYRCAFPDSRALPANPPSRHRFLRITSLRSA